MDCTNRQGARVHAGWEKLSAEDKARLLPIQSARLFPVAAAAHAVQVGKLLGEVWKKLLGLMSRHSHKCTQSLF
jgi:hypothetical protein